MPEDITSATSRGAIVISHITFAPTQTDFRRVTQQFHIIQFSHADAPPLFVELFAGRGSFSRAAIQAGFRVISVDHQVDQPFAPMVTLDLTSPTGTTILWDILSAPGLGAVHMGFTMWNQ